jgi:hypothetical protein
MKASSIIGDSHLLHYLEHQIRLIRLMGARIGSGPSHFHFIRLAPNYDQYWESDSDGAVSFTPHELY